MGRAPIRFTEADQAIRRLSHDHRMLVRCPRCDRMAVRTRRRVTCGNCALVWDLYPVPDPRGPVDVHDRCPSCERRLSWRGSADKGATVRPVRCECGWSGAVRVRYGHQNYRTGCDLTAGLDLWLQTDFRGRALWAVNEDHLAYMERFVAADLREAGSGNGTIASRLPAWVKSAKNREAVVRKLAQMRATLR